MARIAINGFGRIGRTFLRCSMDTNIEIVAINDIADPENLMYLLKYDTVYGRLQQEVCLDGDTLYMDGRAIKMLNEKHPALLPWKEMEVDVVVESTGIFLDRAGASKHLEAGARKVVLSAPAKGDGADVTICPGVNEEAYDPDGHSIISNASCTTNCVAVVAKVLHDAFGVESAFMTTTHAYTASQHLVDAPEKKWRRGRAAAQSIIPTSTGAAKALAKVIPDLDGKMSAIALRVPVVCGSIIDLVCHTRQPVTLESVHAAFADAADSDKMRGILGVTSDQLVSSDILGNSHSAVVDMPSTSVLGDHSVQVLAWYDNEWGYCCRLRDLALRVAQSVAAGAASSAT